MALTTYNITGNLEDALGAKALLGEVTFMPAGTTEDARVDGADAMLGPIRYSIADLPSPMALTEGAWVIAIRPTGRVNGEAQFRTKTIPWNMTAATTWGAIVASAAAPVPLPAPTFDDAIADVLGTGGRTDTELGETLAPRKNGPRDRPRVKQGLRPALAVVEEYPDPVAGVDMRMLWGGTGRIYAAGADGVVRFSTDEGRTWTRAYVGPTTGQWGRDGLFVKGIDPTDADKVLITTYHPFVGNMELKRSADYGVTWTTVLGPTDESKLLGPESVCVSPTTGYVYVGEYVTASPATRPTCNIWRSTDQGATFTVWKTLSRAYDTDPENGVMHVHSIQVDPFTDRLWVCVGDAAKKGGLYRLTADETGWEPIATNEMTGAIPASGAGNGAWAGGVSLMFFPDHIAWGVDQSYTGELLRLARTEFGKPAPVVEKMGPLNSTAFYCAATDDTYTEWVLSASQEGNVAGDRIDNNVHFYRIADNAETVDEILSLPMYAQDDSFSWAFPLGGATSPKRNTGLMWWGTNIYDGPTQGDVNMSGTQFSSRIAWSNQTFRRVDKTKPYGPESSVSSGLFAAVGAGGYRDFGVTLVPPRATTLYIIEANVKAWTAGADPAVEVWRTSPSGVAKLNGGATDASFTTGSLRRTAYATAEGFVHKITELVPGEEIQFRLKNGPAATAVADITASITYAWGY